MPNHPACTYLNPAGCKLQPDRVDAAAGIKHLSCYATMPHTRLTDSDITIILKKKGIYVTNTRITVYRTMYEHKASINTSQIQKLASAKLDRVSVYRALQAFRKKGLIAEIPGTRGWPRYVLTNTSAAEVSDKTSRVNIYFICRSCGAIEASKTCRNLAEFVPVKLDMYKAELLLEGVCSNCSRN